MYLLSSSFLKWEHPSAARSLAIMSPLLFWIHPFFSFGFPARRQMTALHPMRWYIRIALLNSPVEFGPQSHLLTFLLKYSSLYTSDNLMLLLHCILLPTTDSTTLRRQRSLVYPVRPLGAVSATLRPQHVELLPVRVLTHAHTHSSALSAVLTACFWKTVQHHKDRGKLPSRKRDTSDLHSTTTHWFAVSRTRIYNSKLLTYFSNLCPCAILEWWISKEDVSDTNQDACTYIFNDTCNPCHASLDESKL